MLYRQPAGTLRIRFIRYASFMPYLWDPTSDGACPARTVRRMVSHLSVDGFSMEKRTSGTRGPSCGAAHVFHARNVEFRCGEQAVNAVFRTAQDAGNQEAGDFSVLPVRINQR